MIQGERRGPGALLDLHGGLQVKADAAAELLLGNSRRPGGGGAAGSVMKGP